MYEFFNTKTGQVLLSIIWGLGLATMFRRVCTGRNCIVIRGPPSNLVSNTIYGYKDKCYSYTPYISQCNKDAVYAPFK